MSFAEFQDIMAHRRWSNSQIKPLTVQSLTSSLLQELRFYNFNVANADN